MRRGGAAALAAAGGIALAAAVALAAGGAGSPAALLREPFAGRDRLLTNEHAGRDRRTPRSSRWVVTSGSWFVDGGRGWTGIPDGDSPGCCSRRATGSAVFRVVTRRVQPADVEVAFTLRADRLVTTGRTPAQAYDGVHVFLRYRSERELYVASVARRDGAIVIRKKLPGGDANGGHYVDVGDRAVLPLPFGVDRRVVVRVRDVPAGVGFRVLVDGVSVLAVTDPGAPERPITGRGRVGLRGDNADFHVDDLVVRGL